MDPTVAPPAPRAGRLARAGAMSALVALDTSLTVELIRAFPALVATRVDGADRLPFAVQVVVLVAPFVGAAAVTLALAGRLDARRTLVAAGTALAVSRLLAQVVHGDAGAVAAGVGLLGGLVVLAVLAQIGLPLFGGGVIAGVGLASALRIALGSRDLIWIEEPAAVAVVAATTGWFLALLVARARRPVVLRGRSWRASVPLVSLGPVLLLEAFVLTHLGWVAPALERGWLGASLAIGLGAAAGLAAAAWTAASPGVWTTLAAVVGAVAVVSLSAAQAAPGLAWAIVIVLAQVGIGAQLTTASARGLGTGDGRGPSRALVLAPAFLLATVVALDGRGLLGVTVRPSAVIAAAGALLLVGSVAAAVLPAPAAHNPGWRHVPSLALVFVLPAALVLAGLPLLARTSGGDLVGDSREVRVVSYNVQLGFTEGGDLNIEEVAAVLASTRPDVVALQEVPRGFLPAAGIDMIGWLQLTLDMPHVAFQSSSPGSLHGNAVLSRHPIRSVSSRWFPRTGTALPRGALAATIDVPVGADLHVISAHLPPGGTVAERDARVDAVVALWGDRPRTVVALDANARPGSSVMARFAEAGLVVPDVDEATFPSSRPLARIDYVLHSPDLVAVSVEVRSSRASDHLPVVTVVRPADLV